MISTKKINWYSNILDRSFVFMNEFHGQFKTAEATTLWTDLTNFVRKSCCFFYLYVWLKKIRYHQQLLLWHQLFGAMHHNNLDSSGIEVSYKYAVRQNLPAQLVSSLQMVNSNFKPKNSQHLMVPCMYVSDRYMFLCKYINAFYQPNQTCGTSI